MTRTLTIAEKFPGAAKAIQFLLVITLLLFLTGVWMPILTISKLWIFTNEVSVLSGLWQLLEEQQFFVFLLIFLFSVVLPVVKLYYLLLLSTVRNTNRHHYLRYLHWMHSFGRWSMLDVFVVALLIVTIKLGALADVKIETGMYFFTTAVILLMLLTSLMVKLESKLEPG